jgi:hypothetical protein
MKVMLTFLDLKSRFDDLKKYSPTTLAVATMAQGFG